MRPISFDLRCTRCDYNLRGRSPLSTCSECGTSVSDTIVAVSLDEVSQAQLRRFVGFQSLQSLMPIMAGAIGLAALGTAFVRPASSIGAAGSFGLVVLAAASSVALTGLTERIAGAPRILRRAILATVGGAILGSNGVAALVAFGPLRLPALLAFLVALLPTVLVPWMARIQPRRITLHQLASFAVQIPAALLVGILPRA